MDSKDDIDFDNYFNYLNFIFEFFNI